MRKRGLAVLVLAALAATATEAGARGFQLKRIGTFAEPVYVTAPRGDRRRVFVVEQSGRIRVVRDGRTLAAPFLDISDRVHRDGEQGLLSMAFAPDYATSRRFYVFYTGDDRDQHIVEFRATSRVTADPASARTVLDEDDPDLNHNGGQLQFGPDGRLYIGNGDGGGDEDSFDRFGLAQDPSSLFGKILRVDPRSGAQPEVYASGLRNPWRFSFDRRTGALIVGDVGGEQQEEIDVLAPGRAPGANLGWPAFEGTARGRGEAPGALAPVLAYPHGSTGFCAIAGGYVSRDPRVPATRGRYLFGDFCKGDIFAARLRRRRARNTHVHVPQLVSFGEDGRGRVYVVSILGRVLRIVR